MVYYSLSSALDIDVKQNLPTNWFTSKYYDGKS